MGVRQHITTYLEDNRAPYRTQHHRQAFTAQEVAAAEHISGNSVAKVVMVMADEHPVMLVLPASHRVDLEKAAALLEASSVRFAREQEFAARFRDCEIGAMPPLGNLYGLQVCLDDSLAACDEIVFQGGTHTDTVSMTGADFLRLAKPTVGEFRVRH